jgi:hypothetical protein
MGFSGGRTWWAHFAFTRINTTPTIFPKKIEAQLVLDALWRSDPADQSLEVSRGRPGSQRIYGRLRLACDSEVHMKPQHFHEDRAAILVVTGMVDVLAVRQTPTRLATGVPCSRSRRCFRDRTSARRRRGGIKDRRGRGIRGAVLRDHLTPLPRPHDPRACANARPPRRLRSRHYC